MPKSTSRKRTFKVVPGATFGKLTVLGRSDGLVNCRCECGSEKAYPSAGLGQKVSCGCINPTLKTPSDFRNSLIAEVLYRCRYRAARRGHKCTLTRIQVEVLIFDNCHYCGIAPASTRKTKAERKSRAPGLQYNGIDREDAFKGYIFSNCRTCCDRCNSAKMQMTSHEYIAHCARVVEHAAKSLGRSVFE